MKVNIFMILSSYLCLASSLEITEELPWETGRKNKIGWYFLIITLTAGFFLNGSSLYLICFVKQVRSTSMANLLFSLNLVDFLMATGCLIQCIINFRFLELYGHKFGCHFQAIQVGFFSFWQACILALMSYAVERKVCRGINFNNIQITFFVVLTAIYSFLLAIFVTLLPFSGYHLYASGTYCFIDMATPVGCAGFAFGVVVPTAIMADRYYRIWKNVSDAQAILRDRGIETQAKAKYTHTAKKMALFIVTFFGCAVPFLISAIYEWVTWQYSPVSLDIIASNALHLSSVINPLLFYTLNDDAREAVLSSFGCITSSILKFTCKIKIYPEKYLDNINRNISNNNNNNNNNNNHNNTEEMKADSSLNKNYSITEEEWKKWIIIPEYSIFFLPWCEMMLCNENLIFYKNVLQYIERGQKIHAKLLWSLRTCNCPEEFPLEIIQAWKIDLYEHALTICLCHIIPNLAPLEVNISCATRSRLFQVLKIKEDNVINTKDVLPPFPEVWKLPVEEAKVTINEIVHVFDESFVTIGKVIASDVFPRFKKSNSYINSCKEFANLAQNV